MSITGEERGLRSIFAAFCFTRIRHHRRAGVSLPAFVTRTMNLLELKQVTLQRGGHTLFADFSNVIVTGRVTVIMGPNGTGKSSLLLALAGLIPASGEIILRGKPVNEYSKIDTARQVAWHGELPPTEFGLTVTQRLRLAEVKKGQFHFFHSETEEESKLSPFLSAAKLMEVEVLLDRSLGDLSSGERQRIELAALMLRDCPVWLLDEPTAHLDLRHQMICLDMLRRQSAHGHTIVVVLHDIQQTMSIADDVILFDGRGNIEAGAAAAMLTREHLQAVFGVPLHAGSLLPEYQTKSGL